jgi:small GTP-binding protein
MVIWDIAGQSLFENLRKRYYDGSSGIILVYSVVDKVAFENASKWLVEAHRYMRKLPPLIIIGNKVDLRPDQPREDTVSTEDGREFAQRISEKLNTSSVFIETSALTGENIDEAFEALVKMMVDELEKRKPDYVPKAATPSPEAAPGTLVDLSRTADSSIEESVTETPSEETVVETSTAPVVAETSNETEPVTVTPEVSNATETSRPEIVSTAKTLPMDPVTTLPSDSEYLEEEQIGSAMTDLVHLREELRVAEEGLAKVMSELETTLLNHRNIIHVKKIMYGHLQQQLKITRQEWADAYDQYLLSNQRKASEMAQRSRQIKDLRKGIDRIGKSIRSRVGDLDMKKITE